MQEQDGMPVSYGKARLVAGFVLILILLWLLVWLIFFRSTPKPASSHHTTATQSQPASGNTQASGSSATNTDSSQLVNAGAGNVLALFAMAGLAGGIAYQVRLRRRLNS